MNKEVNKKIFSFSLSFILAISFFGIKKTNELESNIYICSEINNELYYKSCSLGDVYIGSLNDISKLIDDGVLGIFVVDERNGYDPNMKIIDSYKVIDKDNMLEILLILKKYEDERPSKWNRSIYTMLNEWKVHNYLYDQDEYISHTKDVDLNNEDEEDYSFSGAYKLFLKKDNIK